MAWPTTSRQSRGYGAAHDRMRKHLMETVILCEECTRLERVTLGTVADHKLPKRQGGSDDRSNYQLLCQPCSDAKTRAERARHGATHPDWLPPARIPLVIVCGPPGAGKTTYARDEASRARGGYVIDLDEIVFEQTGIHGHDQDRSGAMLWLSAALYERNARLAAAGQPDAVGACWFIVSAPTDAERAWWGGKLDARVVLLDPGAALCRERVGIRRAPAVTDWYRRAGEPWERPSSTSPKAKGVDRLGRPTDPNHPWNRR